MNEIQWDEEGEFPKRLYVVCANSNSKPEDAVWTISSHPNKPGWRTDSGYCGYGLPKLLAQELVDCYNQKRQGG